MLFVFLLVVVPLTLQAEMSFFAYGYRWFRWGERQYNMLSFRTNYLENEISAYNNNTNQLVYRTQLTRTTSDSTGTTASGSFVENIFFPDEEADEINVQMASLHVNPKRIAAHTVARVRFSHPDLCDIQEKLPNGTKGFKDIVSVIYNLDYITLGKCYYDMKYRGHVQCTCGAQPNHRVMCNLYIGADSLASKCEGANTLIYKSCDGMSDSAYLCGGESGYDFPSDADGFLVKAGFVYYVDTEFIHKRQIQYTTSALVEGGAVDSCSKLSIPDDTTLSGTTCLSSSCDDPTTCRATLPPTTLQESTATENVRNEWFLSILYLFPTLSVRSYFSISNFYLFGNEPLELYKGDYGVQYDYPVAGTEPPGNLPVRYVFNSRHLNHEEDQDYLICDRRQAFVCDSDNVVSVNYYSDDQCTNLVTSRRHPVNELATIYCGPYTFGSSSSTTLTIALAVSISVVVIVWMVVCIAVMIFCIVKRRNMKERNRNMKHRVLRNEGTKKNRDKVSNCCGLKTVGMSKMMGDEDEDDDEYDDGDTDDDDDDSEEEEGSEDVKPKKKVQSKSKRGSSRKGSKPKAKAKAKEMDDYESPSEEDVDDGSEEEEEPPRRSASKKGSSSGSRGSKKSSSRSGSKKKRRSQRRHDDDDDF